MNPTAVTSPQSPGPAGEGLFARLRGDCPVSWRAYVDHPFVAGMADGSLPEPAFRHYLGQDYLFLIHFARAYALAAFKSETLADMRAAAATLNALVDVEMRLHVDYCAGWGLTEADMEALPEAPACIAYTRFVLDRGMQGDLLDLLAALAPCIVGYGEIGLRLSQEPGTLRAENPYLAWIEMYGGDEYQGVARAFLAQFDAQFAARGSEARYPSLKKTFEAATRLEADFWQMGWEAGG